MNEFREGLVIGIGIGVVIVLVSYLIGNVFGQDVDSRYVCLYANQHPFGELCREQNRLADQQAIMDVINEACELDEALCILGHPDPDFEDSIK
jgi:hypothetical protein